MSEMLCTVQNQKEECYGCTACVLTCPMRAIDMAYDQEGFVYPRIDQEKCIHCGKCVSVCNHISVERYKKADFFAVQNMNEAIRLKSSSGGVFYALAEEVLLIGGIVVGAAYTSNLIVEHLAIEKIEDLYKLQGSKYLQSELKDIFRQIEMWLKNGRVVLFSGTPCQVAGLYKYLGRRDDRLICIDVACHGVPSRKIWEAYLQYRARKGHSRIMALNLRDKSSGWKNYSVESIHADGKKRITWSYDDPFCRLYKSGLILRPSCYACMYKGVERQADITLADFWGIERIAPDIDDDLGTSVVIIHSEKGKNLFQKVGKGLKIWEADGDKVTQYNQSIVRSVNRKQERTEVINSITTENIVFVAQKYYGATLLVTLKMKLVKFIKDTRKKK